MHALKAPLRLAQKAKEYLLTHDLFAKDYQAARDSTHIYFPLAKKIKPPFEGTVVVSKQLPKREQAQTVQELLKAKLTKKEYALLPASFDVVGDILILELPDELVKKEKIIAQAYLEAVGNVKTVVKKSGIHGGVYRTRNVTVLAGKNTKDTVHKENGCRIKVNVENMYFSNRLATERLRLAKQIKPGEDVLVMFSGSGIYPVVFARNATPHVVYGVEINPRAHQYAQENAVLNHVEKAVKLFEGDVNDVLPTIKKKFDRIAMPLPKTGEEFLPLALKKVKPNAMIHLYAFLHEDDIDTYAKTIKSICTKEHKKCRILRKIKCGQHAPRTWRVCYDIKVY